MPEPCRGLQKARCGDPWQAHELRGQGVVRQTLTLNMAKGDASFDWTDIHAGATTNALLVIDQQEIVRRVTIGWCPAYAAPFIVGLHLL